MARIVSDEEWLAARRELLAEEKKLQHARDELAARRRQLPWREVRNDYRFNTEAGERSLVDLFGKHSQLVVYHFMFHPEWEEGCKSCTFWADGWDRSVPHLAARDVSLIAVSRAPLNKLLAYRERMGWSFPWVSSASNDFNRDFHVTFDKADIDAGKAFYNYRETGGIVSEMPGFSAFKRDGDKVFHTYSTYSRGLDPFNPTYQILDTVADGRNEDGLDYSMAWLKRRDEY